MEPDESKILADRIQIAGAAFSPPRRRSVARYAGFDASIGAPIIRASDGGLIPVRRSDSNALFYAGEAVKKLGAGLQSAIDTAPAWRPAPVVPPVAEVPAGDAVPILFTRLNDDGDREFWLGGDRTNPVLLDTFAPLSLITNNWLEGATVISGPSPDIAIAVSLTASSTTGSGKTYTNNVQINIPTYLLDKFTGTLSTDLHMSASVSGNISDFSVSQIGGNTGESLALGEDSGTYTPTIGSPQEFPNRPGIRILEPGVTQISINGNCNYSGPSGSLGTASLNIVASHEFIPCYLSATADKRFILLQPEAGTFYYYEVNAKNNSFTKTVFTSPDPISANPDDWRGPFISYSELDYPPFTVGDACDRAYYFDFGPYNTFRGTIGGTHAANFINGNLIRIDCEQGGDTEKLYYTTASFFDAGSEALVLSQDVQLSVTKSTATPSGSSCTIGTPTTKTLTAKTLGTPDALILAIAPVIV